MLHRIAAIPVLALVFGAVDTLLVRYEFEHRSLGPELFWQAVLLWLALGVVGLAASQAWRALRAGAVRAGRPLLRSWRRLRGRSAGEPTEPRPETTTSRIAAQAAWTAGPVILHMGMDPHTDIGGDLSGLLTLAALRDVGLAVAAVVALLYATRALLARVRPPAVAALAALAALAAGLGWTVHEEGAHAPAPDAALAAGAGERPNVLLMIWDTSRAKSHSLTGYKRETTPRLAELARSSIWFRMARSVSSYTLTSHLSMLTGVYPSHHGARLLRQIYDPGETPSVAQDFAAAGYRTGAFVGTGVLTARTGTIAGFEVYDDLVDPPVADTRGWALVHDVQAVVATIPGLEANGRPHWFQDFQRPAPEVLARAAAWIERPDPRPWFCMINMYDVHWPYLPREEPRERWVGPYDGPITGYLFRATGWDDEYRVLPADREHVKELYDAETWDLDRRVGAFLDRLDLDRTAVVITSDHGEAFGEHGQWEHNDILECQVRVPFLLRPAGGVEGRVDSTPTSGVDVAPTLLDLAGLLDRVAPESGPGSSGGGSDGAGGAGGVEGRPRFFGHSLLRPLPERSILVEDRDHPTAEEVEIAIYQDPWKLTRVGIGEEVSYLLHDIAKDPNGRWDLSEQFPDVVADLRQRLEELRARWGADDEKDGEGLRLSNSSALHALGYVEGPDEGGSDEELRP